MMRSSSSRVGRTAPAILQLFLLKKKVLRVGFAGFQTIVTNNIYIERIV